MAEDIVDDIYEAGVVPERWPALLDRLSGIVGAEGNILFVARQQGLKYIVSEKLAHLAPIYFERGYQFRDERTRRLFELDRQGFVTELDVFTMDEWEEDPIANEFWRPAGLGWGAATHMNIPTGEQIILHAERRRETGPFGAEEVNRLDALRPHLARATLMSARLAFERASGAVTALEAIGLPAGVLDPEGRLFVANRLFDALVPAVFVDRQTRLELAAERAGPVFLMGIQAAIANQRNVPMSIPLPASDGRPPMIVHIVPVRGVARDIFSRASVVVFVTPVVVADVPTAQVIQGLFDLTPTEAKVARALGRGDTVAEIAASNNVAQPTVRNQIREIFAKTGVNRQADLVGLLRGVAGPVDLPGDSDG
ncbi:MAG: LuxR family transcriptional regulator [Hyphomicrobiales bacterium]|nr:MAG: LuxR family transcriptional regulator [Hyphomicrobiales bacterium]